MLLGNEVRRNWASGKLVEGKECWSMPFRVLVTGRAIYVRAICPLTLLLSILSSPSSGAGVTDDIDSVCKVLEPRELSVIYAPKVEVHIRLYGARSEAVHLVQVVVDGVAMSKEVPCPGKFSLNNLAAGHHVLSIIGQRAGLLNSVPKNTSFFVAHMMFWEGQTRNHSQEARCDAIASRSQTCTKGVKFWVIMTAYNAARWIDKAIFSLRRQRHCKFTCVVIDDASTDSTLRVGRGAVCNDERFWFVANPSRMGAAYNQRWALEERFLSRAERVGAIGEQGEAQDRPQDEDVVVWLDADDWFADDLVLEFLASAYTHARTDTQIHRHEHATTSSSGCWMTYGSLVYFPYGVVSPSPPFPTGPYLSLHSLYI